MTDRLNCKPRGLGASLNRVPKWKFRIIGNFEFTMRFKSFTRSIGGLGFSLLFLIAAFARPALAQSDEDASPDSRTAVSKLSVSPKTLSFSVDID
jgi:hypothetical protein